MTSLTSLDAARALEAEWRALFDVASGVTPFQQVDWLLAWYEIWAHDRVQIFAARNPDGKLVGIVPGVQADSRLELAGSGVSDYLAPILDASAVEHAVPALEAALAASRRRVLFHDVPRESPWADGVRRQPAWKLGEASVCPVVLLGRDPEAWRQTLPPGLQRNIRRYGARIVDDAGARFVTVSDTDELPAALDALVRLHEKRWHEQQLPGVFASSDVRRFHQLTAPAMIRSGTLKLHLLQADGAIVGAQYVLVRGSRAYSYVGGFDPAWRKYGPGTLLMAYSIQRAIEDGCREFDLLRGSEPYKYTWGAVDRRSLSLWRDADGH